MDTKYILEQIERDRRDIEKVESLIAILETLPGRMSGPHQPFMIFVSSWEDFRQVRRAFSGRLKPTTRHTHPDGSLFFCYSLDGNFRFTINVDLTVSGKACRREQIGQQVTPLYKIVCE